MFGTYASATTVCHGHLIFIEPEFERLILKCIQVVDRYGLFGALGFQPHRKCGRTDLSAARQLATAFAGSPIQIRMALSLSSSVEILGNLLHLIRHSLGNPAEAGTYLDIAEKVLNEIASNRPLTSAGSVPTRLR
jgi:hypothetical protein